MTKNIEDPKVPKKLRNIARKLELPDKVAAELSWCELVSNPLSVIDQIEIKGKINGSGNFLITHYNMFAVDEGDTEIIDAIKEVVNKRKEKILKMTKAKPQELVQELSDLVTSQKETKPKKTKGTVGFLE